MKRLFLVLALLFSASLPAQAPAPLAHGDVPGEPHHHLKIENEYVRAYYVEVPPHEDTRLHQHDHDYLFISLGPADVVNAVLNKPEVHLVLKDGETHFTRGGFAHVARNLSDAPFRNITIELLKPQGEAQNLCAQIILGAATTACNKTLATSGGHGFTVEEQFETVTAYLNLIHLDPDTLHAGAAISANSLLVVLNDSEIQLEVKDQPTRKLHGGESAWIEADARGVASNPSKNPSNYLQLTMKSAGTNSKP